MSIKLDHCFILVKPGAPEADLLSAVGLMEGSSNSHPGQGTANRRFFFANFTLELLYLRDANEAHNGPGKRLRIADRLAQTDASPFGLVVRRESSAAAPPFPGWRYYPEYFNNDQYFQVGENSDTLNEPLCICMPDNLPARANQAEPDNPGWRLTELRISLPVAQPSATLKAVAQYPGISLILNQAHRLELVFNDAKDSRSHDLTPNLPLIIRCPHQVK